MNELVGLATIVPVTVTIPPLVAIPDSKVPLITMLRILDAAVGGKRLTVRVPAIHWAAFYSVVRYVSDGRGE